MRFLLPSVGDLIFLALLGILLCAPLSVKLLNDGGIGWHIRTGQIIAETHAIPRVDSFSSTMSGRPWFAWEWLYDVGVGQLERIAGLNGVVWLTAVTIAVVFSWTFRFLVRRGASLLLALVLSLLAVSASMIHFLARPHVMSWMFALTWFWILDSSELVALSEQTSFREGKPSKLVWLLPFLMLIWVNIHGGFLIGFVLLGIYWASAVCTGMGFPDSRWEDALIKLRAWRRAKQLLLVGVVSLIMTFCNPYGGRLYAHIYQYLSNRFLIDHIDEFQSPNFHGLSERCFAALMLISLVALVARARRLRLSEVLVVLFAVYSGIYAVRNVPISSLLLVLIAGPLLAENIPLLGRAPSGFIQRMTNVELRLRGHLWALIGAVAAFAVTVNGGYVGTKRLMDAHFGSQRFPVEAINHLEEGQLWGPILAPDYWGGYLIYRLYPKTQVVVDDRHDFYGEDFLRDYVTMIHAERGWEKFLGEHDVRCILVPQGSALANIFALSKDWQESYRDDVAQAFERSSSPHVQKAAP